MFCITIVVRADRLPWMPHRRGAPQDGAGPVRLVRIHGRSSRRG